MTTILTRAATALLLTASLCAPPVPARTPERVLYEGSSAFYDRLYVVERDGLRALRFDSLDGENQTVIRLGQPERLAMPYLRSAAVALTVPENIDRLLIVGLGGGAFANYVRSRLPATTIDAVEIDPEVAGLAGRFFAVKQDEMLRVHVADAVDFLRQNRLRYDFILLDAYDADAIPEALATAAFFRSIRQALAAGGVAVANLSMRDDREAAAMIRRLGQAFAHCLQLRSPPHYNDVVLLAAEPLPGTGELTRAAHRFDAEHTTALDLEEFARTARPCAASAP